MEDKDTVESFLELKEENKETIDNFENLDGFRILALKIMAILGSTGVATIFIGIFSVKPDIYAAGGIAAFLAMFVMMISTIWVYPMSKMDLDYAYQKIRQAASHYENRRYPEALEKMQDLKENSIWTYMPGDDVVVGYTKYVTALENSDNLEEDLKDTFENFLKIFGARYRHENGYGGYLAFKLGYSAKESSSRIQAALLPFKMLFKNQLAAELALHIIVLILGIIVYLLSNEAIAAIFSSIVLSAIIRIAKTYFSEE